jgi:pyruvate/2-oxoglutarate dehydrogenase complex dihydrolipoamide acyltransferase (E2) component
MGTALCIPKLGVSMTEGTIVEWLVSDGDYVEQGQIIYILESDKTETDVEAPASGVIRIEADPDEVYEVGTCIGEIE